MDVEIWLRWQILQQLRIVVPHDQFPTSSLEKSIVMDIQEGDTHSHLSQLFLAMLHYSCTHCVTSTFISNCGTNVIL